jgi:hypothetical protein
MLSIFRAAQQLDVADRDLFLRDVARALEAGDWRRDGGSHVPRNPSTLLETAGHLGTPAAADEEGRQAGNGGLSTRPRKSARR